MPNPDVHAEPYAWPLSIRRAFEMLLIAAKSRTLEAGAPALCDDALRTVIARYWPEIEANSYSKSATIYLMQAILNEEIVGPWDFRVVGQRHTEMLRRIGQ